MATVTAQSVNKLHVTVSYDEYLVILQALKTREEEMKELQDGTVADYFGREFGKAARLYRTLIAY